MTGQHSIILSAEAVTEILTALHGCKSQLGDVANLSTAIKLMEEANEAPSPAADPAELEPMRYQDGAWRTKVTKAGVITQEVLDSAFQNGLIGLDGDDRANYLHDDVDGVEDMDPMPLMLDGDDDKAGGVATMAKGLLRGSRLGDRGRPKPKPYGAN